jgi:polysaccharide export outer membrane protein
MLVPARPPIAVPPPAVAQPNASLANDRSTAARNRVPDDYKIGPEDVLDISVWKNQELSQSVQVRPDGKISLPLVNDVQAAGLTPMQLRDVLVKGYAAYFTQPEISVGVKEVRSIKVSVLGMVKTPGRYDLKSRATVLEALALAGGFSEFAKRDRIFVSRRDDTGVKRLRFDYLKVLDGDDNENFLLLPGDIIIVP